MADGSYRLYPRAIADLEEIWRFTRRTWSLAQAERYTRAIVATFAELASGRLVGRAVDVREGYRKYPAGSHVVFYRGSENGIDIVRVLHRSMDATRHLPRDEGSEPA